MRTLAIIITGFVLSISLIVPSAAQPPVPHVVTDMVASAKKQIKTIDMTGFEKVVDSQQDAKIIDVREPNEYSAGHIPEAINIPRGVIEFKIWPHIGYPEKTDMNIKLYLYCKTGGRCALAARSLKDLGFNKVTAVDMKFADWQAAGHPVTEAELR